MLNQQCKKTKLIRLVGAPGYSKQFPFLFLKPLRTLCEDIKKMDRCGIDLSSTVTELVTHIHVFTEFLF